MNGISREQIPDFARGKTGFFPEKSPPLAENERA
jgi:hypothetical protein